MKIGIRNSDSFFVSDIQEFYELTLLDENKSVQEKTAETIRIANKWEANDGPIIPSYPHNEVCSNNILESEIILLLLLLYLTIIIGNGTTH